MFQESLVESSSLLRGRSRWPAVVSVGVQAAIVAALTYSWVAADASGDVDGAGAADFVDGALVEAAGGAGEAGAGGDVGGDGCGECACGGYADVFDQASGSG